MLATYAYDDLGRRTGLTFGNGVVQSYGFDAVSRLASLTNELSGTSNDLSQTFAYNPASQIASTVRTGDAYAWTGHFNENKTGTPNGLNQLTQVGAKALTHDARGNVTAFGSKSFTYSSEHLLLTGPNGTSLGYDPLMRLTQVASGGATTNLTYDGLDRIAEYDGSNALQRRYVHGPGVDEPLIWYEGSGTTDRRFLGSDERGSIISVTDSSGALLGLNKYDEFGNPQSTNLGIWGYTGQAWLPTVGVWYYKARVYDPEGGFFYQTDPIGYIDSPNLYVYVLNNPVNARDPFGTQVETGCQSRIKISAVCVSQDGRASASGSAGGTPSGNAGGSGGLTFCVQYCDNPQSGEYDENGDIVVYPAPRFFTISGSGYQLQNASFSGFGQSIGNIPRDASGYRFVGSGQVSAGILIEGQAFNLLSIDRELQVITFSFGMAGDQFRGTPLGSIMLSFGPSRNVLAPVFMNKNVSTSFRLPVGISSVTVFPTVATPRGTSFTLRARSFCC